MQKESRKRRRARGYRKGTCAVIIIFFFWEIATSIGYLQIKKTQNLKTLSKTKNSLDLVQLEGGKEKAREERKRGL